MGSDTRDTSLLVHAALGRMRVCAKRHEAEACDSIHRGVRPLLAEDGQLAAEVLTVLGAAHMDAGDPPLALRMLLDAIALSTPLGAGQELAMAWLRAGEAHVALGDYPSAAKAFATSDSVFVVTGNGRDRIDALNGLGYCNWGVLDASIVMDQWLTALHLADSLGEERRGAVQRLNLARFLASADSATAVSIGVRPEDRLDTALALIGQARTVAERSGDRVLLGKALKVNAAVLNRNGQFQRSNALVRDALSLFSEAGDHQWACSGLVDIASNYISMERWGQAKEILNEALALAEMHHLNQNRVHILYRLHHVHKQLGEPAKALLWMERHQALKDSLEGLEVIEKLAQRDLRHRFEQQALADSLTHAEAIRTGRMEAERRLAEQRSRTRGVTAVGAFLLLGGGLFYQLDRRRRRERHERQVAELRNKALRAQMDPHFLGNTLHAVNAYLLTDRSAEASKLLSRFAKWIRLMLEHGRHEEVTLQADLEAMRFYLDLEVLRTANKFTYSILVEDGSWLDEMLIPPMLVQPLLENAIHHGVVPRAGIGSITINVQRRNGGLLISVEDDGVGRGRRPGIENGVPVRTSLGTSITLERLALLERRSGAPARLTIVDLPQGTRAELLLPLR